MWFTCNGVLELRAPVNCNSRPMGSSLTRREVGINLASLLLAVVQFVLLAGVTKVAITDVTKALFFHATSLSGTQKV